MPAPVIAIENVVSGDFADNVIVTSTDNDSIDGGAGNDRINGGSGRDEIFGGEGDDFLDGGNQQDVISGGIGNDYLLGGSGSDWLSGDEGVDTLKGGLGADVFYFDASTTGVDGSDIILDWAQGDLLVFGGYAGNNSLVFTQVGANVVVSVDLGNDGSVDQIAATVNNALVSNLIAASAFEI